MSFCLDGPHCIFGQLIYGKIIVMSDGLNAPNFVSAGASPHTPLGELTVLPRPSSWIKEPTSKKREGKGRSGKGKEGKCGVPTYF